MTFLLVLVVRSLNIFYSGGGVVFILSNEQVVYGAMRSGWGKSILVGPIYAPCSLTKRACP